ncbi:Transcription factor MYB123, partial [Dissostichus eleginoides]
MLAAAQSPPSRRPLLLGSPAHRHLALLRTADWRQTFVFPIQEDHRGDLARSPKDWKLFSPLTSTYRMVGISASFQ